MSRRAAPILEPAARAPEPSEGRRSGRHSRLYWDIIEREIGEVRWRWLERAEADKRPYKMDWALVKVALEQDLRKAAFKGNK